MAGNWWGTEGRFGCEIVNWIDLAQDRDQWSALVNTEVNFRSHNSRGNSWPAEELLASQEGLSPPNHEDTWGTGGLAPLILNLGRFTRSTPGKVHQYLLNRRLGESQSGSGHFGEKNNLLLLVGFKPQTVQSVGWSLYRLSYSGRHLVM